MSVQVLHQGSDVNCQDYDQRTGLILAASTAAAAAASASVLADAAQGL
jgi:hypothetical protein